MDKVAHESRLHGRRRGISGRNRKKKLFSEGPQGGKTDAERTLPLWTLVSGTRGKRQGEGCMTGTLMASWVFQVPRCEGWQHRLRLTLLHVLLSLVRFYNLCETWFLHLHNNNNNKVKNND